MIQAAVNYSLVVVSPSLQSTCSVIMYPKDENEFNHQDKTNKEGSFKKKKLEKRQSKSTSNTHKIKEPAALQPPEESKRKQRTKPEGECLTESVLFRKSILTRLVNHKIILIVTISVQACELIVLVSSPDLVNVNVN